VLATLVPDGQPQSRVGRHIYPRDQHSRDTRVMCRICRAITCDAIHR